MRAFGALALLFILLPQAQAEIIRVRIKKNQSAVELSGLGLTVGAKPAQVLSVSLPQVRHVEIKLIKSKGPWPLWQVRMDKEKQPTRFATQKLFIEGQTLRVGLEPVPNTLELVVDRKGRVDVIASLDLEKYLTGVLPSEMPSHWPIEALKAQVVASRSYAVALFNQRRNEPYHVESTIFDQVFNISNHVGGTDKMREKVAQVVRETAGQVLLDPRGRVIKAYYHADCGGHTELARLVWGEKAFEGGVVKDASCPTNPMAKWRYRLSKQELREALAPYFGVGPAVNLESIGIVGRTASGRVASLDVIFSDHQVRRVSSHELRRLLGFNRLKSTNFTLSWQGEQVVVSGHGYGHGVGLCQYGTKHLAASGLNYRDIVATYYPNAKLTTRGRRGPLL